MCVAIWQAWAAHRPRHVCRCCCRLWCSRVTREALTGYAASVLKKGGSDAIKTLLHGLHPLVPFWLHGGG